MRVTEGYWARRYRFRHRVGGLRSLAAASLLIAIAVAVGIAIGSLEETPDPADPYSAAPLIDTAQRVDVPDVRGMSAREAQSLLERAGLRFERAIAAEGPPGRVLGTLPSIDRSVSSGTPVTLIVGVEAERLIAGLLSSLWSEDSSASP